MEKVKKNSNLIYVFIYNIMVHTITQFLMLIFH